MSKNDNILVISEEISYPKKTKKIYDNNKLYFENTKVFDSDYKLDRTSSVNSQLASMYEYFDKLERRLDKLNFNYIALKIYKQSSKKDDNFNNMFLSLDKYLNKLKRDYNFAEKFIMSFRRVDNSSPISISDVERIYETITYISDYVRDLELDINDFQTKYYKDFKLTDFLVLNGKNSLELDRLISDVESELLNHRNVSSASDYYTYNSGEIINEAINEILKVNNKGIFLDYHYFTKYDAIISLDFNDWVDLISRFKFVFGKLKGRVELSPKFKTLYKEIETRFLIIQINRKLYEK